MRSCQGFPRDIVADSANGTSCANASRMMMTTGTTIAIEPTSLTRPSTAWWKPTALWHAVQAWLTPAEHLHAAVYQDIRPHFPRQETPIDHLVRKHTFLYTCSLMG